MLTTLMILSGAQFLIAVALYRQHLGIIAIVLGLSACASYPFLPDTAHSLILVFPILAVVWLQCRRRQASRATFAVCAAASVAVGWSLTFGPFFPQWFEIQRLAAKYPQVRIDSRLSYERRVGFSVPGAVPEKRDLELTSLINSECSDRYWSLFALEELHNNFFDAFAAQDGFGGERMTFDPPKTELIEMPVDPGPLSIPSGIASQTPKSSGSDIFESIRRDTALTFHREQILNFTNARGFGFPADGKYVPEATPYGPSGGEYVLRGVTRVRGFEPHAFRQLPAGSPAGIRWQLTRLELVSLLKHQPPAAYISEHLPRMQELSSDDTPTRCSTRSRRAR